MQKSKKVNIAVLAQDTEFLLIGKFGFRTGRDYNKLEDTMYITGENGIPIITESAVSYIECNILQEIDCSSHILFVLEAQEASVLNNKPALTYDYYHKVLKGKKGCMFGTENRKIYVRMYCICMWSSHYGIRTYCCQGTFSLCRKF